MPALTAAAAAAAIAQISMNPGGLLPQLAPYLQSYMPPAPQHTSLQHHMLHSSAPVPPHLLPFAKTTLPHAGLPRYASPSIWPGLWYVVQYSAVVLYVTAAESTDTATVSCSSWSGVHAL